MKKRNLIPILSGMALMALVVGVVLFIKDILSEAPPKPERLVQQITLLKPPPPPPPPPKVEEPPKPEVEQKIEEPEPEAKQESDEPPPGEDLGLDADGGAGSDAFGLRGKKGGRGLIGGGNGFAGYGRFLQREIQAFLAGKTELRSGSYSVVVKLWLNAEGRGNRSELAGTSGDARIDSALKLALSDGLKFRQPPPEGLPQPVKLRISSHAANQVSQR
jgi:protein TonB